MRKKLLLVLMICAALGLLLAGCNTDAELLPPDEAYHAFEEKLANTTALSVYDVTVTHEEDGISSSVRYALTENLQGEPVAMRVYEDGTEYYYRGVRYFTEGDRLRKAAVSLDVFLNNAAPEFAPDSGRVGGIKSLENGVAFDYASADFDSLRITVYFRGAFIESISAEYSLIGGDGKKVVVYEYRNAGAAPEITLPENLSEYTWM